MLADRVIIVNVYDQEGEPVVGAVVTVFVNGYPVVIADTIEGWATIQISPTSETISIEAKFGEFTEKVTVGQEVERWAFTLPFIQGKHLVILVHGINTRGHWMNTVGKTLEKTGLECEPAGYGFYGVLRFLIPIDWLRRSAMKRVVTRIDAAIHQHKPARISIISHSFGTYVVSRIIQNEFRFKFHRVIFCGSVVSAKFPFEQYTERFNAPILNEIGTRDHWPAVAESVTWGYGSIGSHGYQGAPLVERWYRGFRHSDFLTADHCTKAWLPFLKKGKVVDADDSEELPVGIRLLTMLPIRWVLVALIVFFLGTPWISGQQWSARSAWMDGGSNPIAECQKLALGWEAENRWYRLRYKPDREEQDWTGIRHAIYRYNCSGTADLRWFSWRSWF